MNFSNKINKLIPFIPFIIIFIFLIIRPYYLFPLGGDTDFHLARAREILDNPIYGLFWDNITYYPMGRPVWHQPLFHCIYAFLWFLGGVRFAQAFMSLLQVLLTVLVASWVSNKDYGIIAGYFAGLFALFIPAPSTFIVPIPATYVPIFAVLTIHYIPKDKKKAVITAILGLWTHMVAIVSFIPLFIVDNYKNKTNLKIIALLAPSWILWVTYWIYFKDRLVTGGIFYSITHMKYISVYPTLSTFYVIIVLYTLGIIGLSILYKTKYKQFKLYFTYIILTMLFSLFGFNGDFLRGFQFAALPMAILSGLTVQRGYELLSKNYKPLFSSIFILVFLFVAILGSTTLIAKLSNQNGKGWDALNYPFEEEYAPLKNYIETHTNSTDIIWTNSELTEKVAWMTGRKVSNGLYTEGVYGSTRGFKEQHQKINIYQTDKYFLINNFNNQSIAKIKIPT